MMRTPEEYRQFAILYVDDEEQSLKYFKKAFDQDFRILTASNVDDAIKLIQGQGDELALLITDQRMPGKPGVHLLNLIRQSHPNVVRILTTAYSDLDSAIEAVNSGAIYKYIVKPWNIRDLRGTLLRAVELFLLQRERDELMREKMSVLQRMIVADRVRSLAILAAGLAHHIRNSMSALTTFIEMAPLNLKRAASNASTSAEVWDNLWALAQRESRRILEIVERVSDVTGTRSYSFDTSVAAASLMESAARNAKVEIKSIIPADLPALKADKVMLERCLTVLLNQLASLTPKSGHYRVQAARLDSVWGTPGLELRIGSDGQAWTHEQMASLFTPFVPAPDDPRDLGLDLLSAFFIVHHHGGEISVDPSSPSGPGFVLRLPFDPNLAKRPDVEPSCLEKLFTRFDREDANI